MTMCLSRRLSLALQGGFLLQILQSSPRTQKTCPALQNRHHTHTRKVYNISQVSSSDNFCSDMLCPCPVIISNRFRLPLHVSRCGFPWHVLSKQRSCPLITRFSSIRV